MPRKDPLIEEEIKFYLDKACKKPVKTIEWDKDMIITLVDGTEERVKNAAKGGDLATATIFLRNESRHRFAITKIYHPDKRLKIKLESGWLDNIPVKLTVTFIVPNPVSLEDVIKADKILIEGYYIYSGR